MVNIEPLIAPTSAGMFPSLSPFLQVVVNPNGTLTRPPFPTSPPNHSGLGVPSKDIPINHDRRIGARLYAPKRMEKENKLPIILFFHGGGFILFSTATTLFHLFCAKLADGLPAVVVSIDYRLAPEFRLPAAYEDAREAIRWLRLQAEHPPERREPALRVADFSRCFLMGSSSGGNIVYHAGLQAFKDWKPNQHHMNITAMIMHQPYFGGVERTPSELAMEEDLILPLRATDLMWDLSLPKGTDRDHPYSNPVISPPKAQLRALPRCLVTGNTGDPLVDRQRQFVEMLVENKVQVVHHFSEGSAHGAELFDPFFARKLIDRVRDFVHSS